MEHKSTFKKMMESLFNEIEINSTGEMEGNYPPVTVQVSTVNGTLLLLYKGDVRGKYNVYSDVHFKTTSKFRYILSRVRELKSTKTTGGGYTHPDDKDVVSILLNLNDEELNTLEKNKIVVTTNIPAEIMNLTGKHVK